MSVLKDILILVMLAGIMYMEWDRSDIRLKGWVRSNCIGFGKVYNSSLDDLISGKKDMKDLTDDESFICGALIGAHPELFISDF